LPSLLQERITYFDGFRQWKGTFIRLRVKRYLHNRKKPVTVGQKLSQQVSTCVSARS